jgi:hypothetical protein
MLFLSFVGCKSQIINNKDIGSIIVEDVNTAQKISITDNSQIAQLLKIINSSSREFYIFVPDYRVTILYANNEKKELLLKGVMLKIDGVPYKASKKLSKTIETYFTSSLKR